VPNQVLCRIVLIKIHPSSNGKKTTNMASTLRNMRATGITSKEIPMPLGHRKTLRGIPAVNGVTPKPPVRQVSYKRCSVIFGTPTRYSGQNVSEEQF
jgi:hypothetical protein